MAKKSKLTPKQQAEKDDQIEALIKQVEGLHIEIRQLGRTQLEKARDAGQRLLQIQKLRGRGGFKDWLNEKRVCGCHTIAYIYIKVANNWDKGFNIEEELKRNPDFTMQAFRDAMRRKSEKEPSEASLLFHYKRILADCVYDWLGSVQGRRVAQLANDLNAFRDDLDKSIRRILLAEELDDAAA